MVYVILITCIVAKEKRQREVEEAESRESQEYLDRFNSHRRALQASYNQRRHTAAGVRQHRQPLHTLYVYHNGVQQYQPLGNEQNNNNTSYQILYSYDQDQHRHFASEAPLEQNLSMMCASRNPSHNDTDSSGGGKYNIYVYSRYHQRYCPIDEGSYGQALMMFMERHNRRDPSGAPPKYFSYSHQHGRFYPLDDNVARRTVQYLQSTAKKESTRLHVQLPPEGSTCYPASSVLNKNNRSRSAESRSRRQRHYSDEYTEIMSEAQRESWENSRTIPEYYCVDESSNFRIPELPSACLPREEDYRLPARQLQQNHANCSIINNQSENNRSVPVPNQRHNII